MARDSPVELVVDDGRVRLRDDTAEEVLQLRARVEEDLEREGRHVGRLWVEGLQSGEGDEVAENRCKGQISDAGERERVCVTDRLKMRRLTESCSSSRWPDRIEKD